MVLLAPDVPSACSTLAVSEPSTEQGRKGRMNGNNAMIAERWNVSPFLYRCPNTGDNVQAWAADDPDDDDLTYVQVTCLACAQAHLVNPKTGKVLGSDDE